MSIDAMSWAFKQELPPAQKLVLLSLADHYNGMSGICIPGQDSIARQASMSVRTVQRHLKELETSGVIRRQPRFRAEGRGRTSDRYFLNFKPDILSPSSTNTSIQDDQHDTVVVGTVREPEVITSHDEVGAVAPVTPDVTVLESGQTSTLKTAAGKNSEGTPERAITDSKYASRLLDELGDAAPDLHEERLADNYLTLYEAARTAGKKAEPVAIGLALGLLVKTFGPLPANARGMVARLVKANGPTAVMHGVVTTVGSTVGSDVRYADDPLGPVRYLSGVVRGRK